jgi:uncharacterized protein YkwD
MRKFFMNLIVKRIIVLCACLILLLSLAQGLSAKRLPSLRSVGGTYQPDLERAIFQYTNEVRRKNGLPSLTWENCLRDVARAHSADMLARHYFSHNSPEGSTPDQRIRAGCRLNNVTWTGENIWMGTNQRGYTQQLARHIVDNWMSSPGHRANLLRPQFTDIGIGAASNGREVQVTQAFISHR